MMDSVVRLLPVVFIVAGLIGLGGCENTANSDSNAGGTGLHASPGPVVLGPNQPQTRTDTGVVVMPLDQAASRRALNNYRINKGGSQGPYRVSGADLNGDGRPEIIAYFSGESWCAKTGCTLVVLTPADPGYRTVSTIKRVQLPVSVGPNSSNGWRNIIVKTGGHGMPVQTVTLEFSGNRYPVNATLVPGIPADIKLQGELLLDEGMETQQAEINRVQHTSFSHSGVR